MPRLLAASIVALDDETCVSGSSRSGRTQTATVLANPDPAAD